MLILSVCYGADGLGLGTGGWLWGLETCFKYLLSNFSLRRMGFGFGCHGFGAVNFGFREGIGWAYGL